VNQQFVIRGNAQGVEVSAALRLLPVQRFTDTAPHVVSRSNVDMRPGIASGNGTARALF